MHKNSDEDRYWLNRVENIVVCLKFIQNIFQIKPSKIENVRNMKANNKNYMEKRGRPIGTCIKIDKNIFEKFINNYSIVDSHYTNSKLKYFQDRELTPTTLFNEFKEYILEINNPVSICFNTFINFFRDNYNYKFRTLRTDICDFCFEHEQKQNKLTDLEIIEKSNHDQRVEKYNKLKTNLINNNNNFCIEFDFSQNRNFPIIPNAEAYYKRNISLYIFNVHIHNKNSYMFHTIEGISSKDPNSVCSNLFKVIELQFSNLNNDITAQNFNYIFFSDGCPGQNRNWVVLFFLSFISIKFNIKIKHIFPVRGHSFNVCDRNFSILGRKLRKLKTIETHEKIIKYLKQNKKFEVLKSKVFDYKTFLNDHFSRNNNIKISKGVIFQYNPDGSVIFCDNYDNSNETIFYPINSTCDIPLIKNLYINDNLLLQNIGLDKNKLKDVKSLVKYLKEKNKPIMNKLLNYLEANVNNLDDNLV